MKGVMTLVECRNEWDEEEVVPSLVAAVVRQILQLFMVWAADETTAARVTRARNILDTEMLLSVTECYVDGKSW